MPDTHKTYIAIDLKSFYASVECIQRGYNPLTTNLVVADKSRTDKTICLAVSPSLKALGIPGRPRLFEVVQQVKQINAERLRKAPRHQFIGKSILEAELKENAALELDYVVAPPQMAKYIEASTAIYETYLKYISADDIHVYSIDEVFIDATEYLSTYKLTGRELAMRMIRDVLTNTGITATAGVATNLFLCKIAMDIEAKHIQPDKDGVRIAELDERSFREKLWDHRPLTDFWRVGHGIARKLEAEGLHTLGDVARFSASKFGRDRLHRLFGVNAELIIDHAWGYEPCTMQAIKQYGAKQKSLSSGQVLTHPYKYDKAKLIVREMADALSLDLMEKQLITDKLTLTIGYDRESLTDPNIAFGYKGSVTLDHYGRKIPKHAHGTVNLPRKTASTKLITDAALELFARIVDKALLVRRVTIAADLASEAEQGGGEYAEQLDIFSLIEGENSADKQLDSALEREKRKQSAILAIQRRYGKNALVKGMNLEEDATMMSRNGQIGGHKA